MGVPRCCPSNSTRPSDVCPQRRCKAQRSGSAGCAVRARSYRFHGVHCNARAEADARRPANVEAGQLRARGNLRRHGRDHAVERASIGPVHAPVCLKRCACARRRWARSVAMASGAP
eukprot:4628742-Pleurochrysis_carterae.AAC.1